MVLTPIKDMIGEQVHAHPEGLHAAEDAAIGHLAVLQRVAMIATRMGGNRAPNHVRRQFAGLVTVGVNMQVMPGTVIGGDDPLQLARCNIPKPVGGAVMVARPAQAGGEALD